MEENEQRDYLQGLAVEADNHQRRAQEIQNQMQALQMAEIEMEKTAEALKNLKGNQVHGYRNRLLALGPIRILFSCSRPFLARRWTLILGLSLGISGLLNQACKAVIEKVSDQQKSNKGNNCKRKSLRFHKSSSGPGTTWTIVMNNFMIQMLS